jgi:hypothetical protein
MVLQEKRPEDFEVGTLQEVRAPKEMKGVVLPVSAGGVYIPPFKLRKIMDEMKQEKQETVEHQKY